MGTSTSWLGCSAVPSHAAPHRAQAPAPTAVLRTDDGLAQLIRHIQSPSGVTCVTSQAEGSRPHSLRWLRPPPATGPARRRRRSCWPPVAAAATGVDAHKLLAELRGRPVVTWALEQAMARRPRRDGRRHRRRRAATAGRRRGGPQRALGRGPGHVAAAGRGARSPARARRHRRRPGRPALRAAPRRGERWRPRLPRSPSPPTTDVAATRSVSTHRSGTCSRPRATSGHGRSCGCGPSSSQK